MSGHTPGPWVAIQLNKRLELFARTPIFPDGLWAICQEQEPELLPIAVLDHCDDHDAATRQRTGENARLIAAAPDLLEALIEAENALADYIPTMEKRLGSVLNYGHKVLAHARIAIAKAEGK